jgi:outer membrane protein TolC
MLQKQIVIAEDNLSNYMKLLRGEELRFGIGETSLFFVNSRENKVLDAKRKLAELRMKYFTSLQSIRWAMGQMR